MDKIKELLKKIGASDELAAQLMEQLDKYAATIREQYEKKYQERITQAKKICVEEVTREKAAIARRVEIFLESKVAAIERTAARQRAIEESAAVATLRKLKGVIGAAGEGNSEELQALQRKLARISEQTVTLKEERDHAVQKANRANSIATRVLRRNRILESTTKGDGKVVTEGKGTAADAGVKGAPVVKPEAETIVEDIAAGRTPRATPATTRQTKTDAPSSGVSTMRAPAVAPSVDEIAASMDKEDAA